MDREQIKKVLIEVLLKVQEDSGYSPVKIVDTTKPIEELEGFDSKVWPVSITLLSRALGIDVPKKTRLYEDEAGSAITIAEVVEKVWKVVELQSKVMRAQLV